MKKLFLSISALMLSFILVSCVGNNDNEITNKYGLTMYVDTVTNEYVSASIDLLRNDYDGEITTGPAYTIERYDEETNKWVDAAISMLSWNDIAYIINGEESILPYQFNCPLEFFDMHEGNYRLVKKISIYSKDIELIDELTLYAEFYYDLDVDNNNVEENNEENNNEENNIEEINSKWGYDADLKAIDDSTYKLVLSGNPTTGYSWNVYDTVSTFRGVLCYVDGDGEYVSDVDNSKLPPEMQRVGAGGKYTFTIKVQEPKETYDKNETKETKLYFRYYRVWEGADNFIAMCEVTFHLNEDGSISYSIAK